MVLLFIRNEFCWKACFYVQLRDLLGLTKSKWEQDLFARVANTYSPFKGTLLLNSTMNSRMQAICKMVNFCWINIAVCCLWWCLYNLLCCWKMLFLESLSYCFLLLCGPAVLARPEDTFQRKWWLKANTYVNSHRFFRNLFLWARPMHTFSSFILH